MVPRPRLVYQVLSLTLFAWTCVFHLAAIHISRGKRRKFYVVTLVYNADVDLRKVSVVAV